MPDKIKVISRDSNLARIQVKEAMSLFPDVEYELTAVKTLGDKQKDISLMENNISDFFTREIDKAILNNEAGIAVHSAKDLPFPLPEGIMLYALTGAHDQTDALVSRNFIKLTGLEPGAKIGTSSLKRKDEILKLRPDLQIVSIRGTIEERIEQLDENKIDALIVATCALKRLGLEHRISEILPFETHPLQGHLAITGKRDNYALYNIFNKADIRKKYGKVSIVGFGPGNPEYLTIRGHKLLQEADAIYYDDLLDNNYLDNFNAEKVYVGKRKGHHSKTQDEINELLYKSALAGKNTIRLKGGDPSVFGRAGEELVYLTGRLIRVEIVPGVTTASAAAALSGISLTHRGKSASVAFCTGHSVDNIQIPKADTLVWYMAATNLHNLAEKHIAQGWSAKIPVAVISNVSMVNEQIIIKTLEEIVDEKYNAKTPAVVIIGNVADKKFINHYLNNLPNILVTGTNPDKYRKEGRVRHSPLISIKPSKVDVGFTNRLEMYDYIIFTSRYGVKYFFNALLKSGKDARKLYKLKIVSIGEVTTRELKLNNLVPDIQPADESSEGIVSYFRENNITNQKILLPRSKIGLDVLPSGLNFLGNKVDILNVYENFMPENHKQADLSKFHHVTFSSPSCVDNFIKQYKKLPKHIVPFIKGNETRKRMIETGLINS